MEVTSCDLLSNKKAPATRGGKREIVCFCYAAIGLGKERQRQSQNCGTCLVHTVVPCKIEERKKKESAMRGFGWSLVRTNAVILLRIAIVCHHRRRRPVRTPNKVVYKNACVSLDAQFLKKKKIALDVFSRKHLQ